MCLGCWHHQKEKEKGNGKEIVMGTQSIENFMVSLELAKQSDYHIKFSMQF